MLLALEISTVLLVAITMGLALAHALEFPGKLRLDEQAYMSVQTIYYPGFTIGGFAEPLGIIATFTLLFFPKDQAHFWLILIAFCGVFCMQIVFWFVTQPANRFWLRHGFGDERCSVLRRQPGKTWPGRKHARAELAAHAESVGVFAPTTGCFCL